jgi:hypothetical protein
MLKLMYSSETSKIFYLFLLSYYCCTGATLWHLQNFLQYIIVKSTLSIILLYPPSPFLEYFQYTSFFHFHTWIHNISTIFTVLLRVLISSPLPLVPTPDRTCFTFLLSIFEKGHLHSCLFKIAIQGVSLWQFYVYMCYKPNWFILSIFSPFYLSTLLMVISTGLKILYSFF